MLECYFCGKKIESITRAIEAGWVPGFFDPQGDDDVSEPVSSDALRSTWRRTRPGT